MGAAIGTAFAFGAFAFWVAIGAVAAVEKLGGELGGLIATWPTTVIPTMMAIRLNSSSQEQFRNSACTSGHAPGIRTCAVGAFTSSCPFFTWCHMISPCAHDLSIRSVTLFSFSACVSQMTNTTTLLVWKFLPAHLPQHWSIYRTVSVVTLSSCLLWLMIVAAIRLAQSSIGTLEVLHVALFAGCASLLQLSNGVYQCLLGARQTHQHRPQVPAPAGTKSVSRYQHFFRGFFSFIVVTLGAVLSYLGRSFEATVVALFPSVFIPIMVGSWLAQGKAVPFGAVGPLTIGSMCTPFYSAINYGLSGVINTGSLALDISLCALSAFAIVVIFWSLPVCLWLRHLRRRNDESALIPVTMVRRNAFYEQYEEQVSMM